MKKQKSNSKVILPQISINRELPSNYSKKTSYVGKTQEVRMINYGKAYVNAHAMVFRGLSCMEETLPELKKNFHQKQKLITRLYFKTKIKKEKGVVLVVFDGFYSYYYHWLCDAMVRIFVARKEIGKEFKIALPLPYYKNNFCMSSLKMLGIGEDQVIVIDKTEAIKSDHLLYISCVIGGGLTYTSYDPAILGLRDEMLRYAESNGKLKFNFGKKIFISRSRQKKRIIINQKEVDEMLIKYGFVIVNMEDFDFEDGVSIVYNADYIISQCGSNLTNIMFAQKGAKVLELYPKKEYGDANGGTWFSELSQACDLKHSYQYCEIDKNNFFINEFHTDMIVDIKELERRLKSFEPL